MGLQVVILAAGKGTRMFSDTPKVLHKIGGKSMLEHVVSTAYTLNADKVHVVYGAYGTAVQNQLPHLDVNWIYQDKQLGTGHALLQALPFFQEQDRVLVLYGDVPMIATVTLKKLLEQTPKKGVGLIVTELENPTGFGRIVRNEMANIVKIVEHKDADEEELKINEINTGILTTTASLLNSWLPNLKNSNKQGEYYLTDIIAAAVDENLPVGGVMAHDAEEVLGVNDRWQLANLERYYQETRAKELAYKGVTFRDAYRVDFRGDVDAAQDVVIDANVIFEGKVTIGKGSEIGANVILRDVQIGENVKIKANCVIENSQIQSNSQVGPFAHIRPGCILEPNSKVGNFVELKQTRLGMGSKANHLSYLGDSNIGKNVNIGAGTITCNYDGQNKHPTFIGNGAFIGSNTILIAPVEVGENAYIAGGSAISKTAPANKLTIARAKQQTIDNWQPPFAKNKQDELNTTE